MAAQSKAAILAGIKRRAIAKGKNPSAADIAATYAKYRTASGGARSVVKGRKVPVPGGYTQAISMRMPVDVQPQAPRPIRPPMGGGTAKARPTPRPRPPAMQTRPATARTKPPQRISGPDKPPTRPGGYARPVPPVRPGPAIRARAPMKSMPSPKSKRKVS